MKRNRMGFGVGVMVVLFGVGCTQTTQPPELKNAATLPSVHIVATLDEPVEKNRTAIYCGSFVAAWKEAERKFTKGPILLTDAPAMAGRLNRASDPAKVIPAGALYVAAGFGRDDIRKTITDGLKEKFGQAEAPTILPAEIAPDDFIAYALLKVVFEFKEPFWNNKYPMTFTAADGKQTGVSTFGLPSDAKNRAGDLREQVAILTENVNEQTYRLESIAIELDRFNKTHQVILAMVTPEATLAKTIEKVEADIASAAKERGGKPAPTLGMDRTLLVPDLKFHLRKRFTPLIGKFFKNPGLTDTYIADAIQDTEFILNRKGVKLRSEAMMWMRGGAMSPRLVFDKPFLLYIKQRGTNEPYFAIWVSDAIFMTKKE